MCIRLKILKCWSAYHPKSSQVIIHSFISRVVCYFPPTPKSIFFYFMCLRNVLFVLEVFHVNKIRLCELHRTIRVPSVHFIDEETCPADESDTPKSTRLDSISVSGLQCRGSLLLSGSFLAIWNGSEGACKGGRPGRGWHASFHTKCRWHHEGYAMCQGWVRLTDFLNHEANSTWLCDLGLWSLIAGLLPSRPWVLFFSLVFNGHFCVISWPQPASMRKHSCYPYYLSISTWTLKKKKAHSVGHCENKAEEKLW